MKKIPINLDYEELVYFAQYTSQADSWFKPDRPYASLEDKLLCHATAAAVRKLAINLAVRLTKPKQKNYKITLGDGRAEAVLAFMMMQTSNYPLRIHDSIINQIHPFFT